MPSPLKSDYFKTYFTLYEHFEQGQTGVPQRGHPFDYTRKCLILFFSIMMMGRITAFKAQHRWLKHHPEERRPLGLESVPDRTTLSRRYRHLYAEVQAFIAYLGRWAEGLSPEFGSRVLIEDASLFKAQGPVWHQSDRVAKRVPEKLRHLDQDASWGKSAYHGWVYGHSLHLSCNRAGFPKLVQVETASLDESKVFEQKKEALLPFFPKSLLAIMSTSMTCEFGIGQSKGSSWSVLRRSEKTASTPVLIIISWRKNRSMIG